jgi:hypothetical protein
MKDETKEALALALNNAGAMIDSHGEEGGQYQEDYEVDIKQYFKQCKKVAKMLYKKAEKIRASITTKKQ